MILVQQKQKLLQQAKSKIVFFLQDLLNWIFHFDTLYNASEIRVDKVKHYLLFCSSSLMFSGGILSLSTWSRSTLAHFCSDSIMVQGRDISATNTARQSGSDWAETANLSRPLWYRSPSRIHTLQRVRSAKENTSNAFIVYNYWYFVKSTAVIQPQKGHSR